MKRLKIYNWDGRNDLEYKGQDEDVKERIEGI